LQYIPPPHFSVEFPLITFPAISGLAYVQQPIPPPQ
jgi:hypothetical protein